MKLYLIKLTLAFIPLLFAVDNNNWKVKSSTITFKIKNAGIMITGSLTGLESEIIFNPLKPEESNIKASVSSKSINTGMEMRDNHLRKQDYFDVDKYPKITMQSTKIEKTGPISFTGTFKLTIKNVTKEIILPFTFIKTVEKAEFKGNFSINRLDYTIGENSWTLADDVDIDINIAANN